MAAQAVLKMLGAFAALGCSRSAGMYDMVRASYPGF